MEKGSPVAVLDIGTIALRLVVAQLFPKGEFRILDRAVRNCPLGKDVFETGRIGQETMLAALQILKDFCELLSGWGIPPQDVRVIATSALREARNSDAFVERVERELGLRIKVVEGIEQGHLTYLAVQKGLSRIKEFARTNALILEVGGGSTEIMVFKRGKMVSSHSLNLGTVRLLKQVPGTLREWSRLEHFVREAILGIWELLNSELPLERIATYVAVGGDPRFVASRVGRREKLPFWRISKEGFLTFLHDLKDLSPEDCVRKFSLSFAEAENLLPALLIHREFLLSTAADELIVPDVSIREGVLVGMALGSEVEREQEFYPQIIASAENLARKFSSDLSHALFVRDLALTLFDALSSLHGMDSHDRLVLEVAAILHDVGRFVHPERHEVHGAYLVRNSDLFGFSKGELEVAARVIELHRGAWVERIREISDPAVRFRVKKLASLLRVADALDRSHRQRFVPAGVEVTEREVLVRSESGAGGEGEALALREKGDLFEEVWGRRIRLV
ncbi:Ppx/GppA phosphatase [Spirochaeta thermophila DSM 6578]|uniref:Ppx/GppA phosphatase n=1 Tax=Winmispira thermophila (strain ATCC 700085 / DSM 6578 / Z-1203) TaxID=869211 RepID=G0GG38_WINT7|nr:HD domain-containing protein [Spirochaeta thermophila]AEJ62514.1 Ppx/GppA phosphatase [Spirochaeta thermophila DSM 6578]